MHNFWRTQPVPQNGQILPPGPIETVNNIRTQNYKLLDGFEWCTLDLNDEQTLEKCYRLLRNHYVEDPDAMFRFDYSKEFLKWALMIPGFHREWHIGVLQSSNKKIRAIITGVPQTISIDGHSIPVCEINFLCIHKKLRSKRLTPVLIKEITRRVNIDGIFQAMYTAGVNIPTPIGRPAKYWHRSLNIRKLIDIDFTYKMPNQTIQSLIRLYNMPEQTNIQGWRAMGQKDSQQTMLLINRYLEQFKLHTKFQNIEEFEHIFLPREGVICSYVVENDGIITDFGSFYYLFSSIMKHPEHKVLKAVYSYYNVPGKLSLTELYRNLLIEAQKQGIDVFNALDLMNNQEIYRELKFHVGDGSLHYYLFNYSMGEICNPEQIGVILV